MRVSLQWLTEFVELPPLVEVCERLAAAGVEVEAVHDPAAACRGVVVGEVLEVGPHPNAARLQLCRVGDGVAEHQVVCGAANVAAGQKVALARVGARLGDVTIAERAVRGVPSAGMLCARAELGIDDAAEGIWVLPASCPLGADVFAATEMGPVLTLGITPNRPDLLCHLGVARELAAATGKRVSPGKWRLTEKGPDSGALARAVVEDGQGCRRYVARVVRHLKVGPSPSWLVERLQAVGQRSVNNVVDVTNYVMQELGQPLHAFDLGRLAVEAGCPTVRVRRATAGEKLTTLDGVERSLCEADLVVADAQGPVALAGILGGSSTEVSAGTTSILLESAYFDPTSVRRSAKAHGLRTEASLRFERGVDVGITVKAVDRCAQLLGEVAGAEVAKGLLETTQKQEGSRDIQLRLERVPRLLGITLGAEAVMQLLDPLEIRCSGRIAGGLIVQPPSFRPDVTREIDVIEEIARRHGYERLGECLPSAAGPLEAPRPRAAGQPARLVRGALLAAGCTEVVTYGFGKPEHFAPYEPQRGAPLRLLNPLGADLGAMRTSLVPGLLQVLRHNLRHGTRDVRIFEVGTTFHARTPAADEDERQQLLPAEVLRVSIVMLGGRADGRWHEGGESVDFGDLRGVLEALAQALQLTAPLSCTAAPWPTLNPHCSARLTVGGREVGSAGLLTPRACQQWELPAPPLVAEVDLGALAQACRSAPRRHVPLPRFPSIRRDVAVIARRDQSSEALALWLRSHAGGELGPEVVRRVALFDVYQDDSLGPDRVSLAFSVVYGSAARTLTDAEVGTAFAAAVAGLAKHFALEVR